MPIRHAIWKVGTTPEALTESSLGTEALLEQMIVRDPAILSERWMLIGKQVRTSHGGIIDLLALNADAQIIVIELKRNLTSREVVAQALDYASCAKQLTTDELAAIYSGFANGASLGDAFKAYFSIDLDEEQLNGSHQIVVVASILDPSTERIVNYLNEMDVPINVIFFQVFNDGANQYLSRAWLLDPVDTESKASVGSKVEWNGEYYVSFGHAENRDWSEAKTYGFISAGGGTWYTKTLLQIEPNRRVWVNIPRLGYVGVGTVTGPAVPAKDFFVEVEGVSQRFLDIGRAGYHREHINDEEMSEYFVPVRWNDVRDIGQAVAEVGFFGNQNTIAKPKTSKWEHTVDRLKRHFPRWEGS